VIGFNMLHRSSLFSLLFFTLMHVSMAGRCLLEKPLPGITGKEVGLIIVPGAHLPGESYMPLLREIQVKAIGLKQYLNHFFLSLTLKRIVDPITPLFQASYPGPLWIGSTAEWLGDMPTPIEVTQQIGNCLDAARSSGLSTDDVFMAGHR